MLPTIRALPLLAGAAGVTLITGGSLAHAFAEDVCYLPGGGTIASCLPLPEACQPAGTASMACLTAIVAAAAQQANFDGGRSTIHTDTTFLLAQAAGFSATDAYWIAAYDEATDLGSFQPRDNRSLPIGGTSLITADISGVVRGNLASGGVLLHFIAPYNGGSATPPPINGLAPNPLDAQHEPTLANLRAWALASSSAARPGCTAGLTERSAAGDYATGAACYPTGTPIAGTIAAIGALAIPFNTATGPQIVRDTQGLPTVYAPAFDTLVASDGAHDASAAHASDARIGIYLHALADRITHHVCTDRAAIAGPTTAGFRIDLDNDDCKQPIHLLRHAWETGVTFAMLDSKDRTTEAMLSTIYDELLAMASARGVLRAGAGTAMAKSSYVTPLVAALQKRAALDRVTAINAIACNHRLATLPGQPACP